MAWLRRKVSGGSVVGACRGVVGARMGARRRVVGAGGRKPSWRSVASMIGTMIGAPVD